MRRVGEVRGVLQQECCWPDCWWSDAFTCHSDIPRLSASSVLNHVWHWMTLKINEYMFSPNMIQITFSQIWESLNYIACYFRTYLCIFYHFFHLKFIHLNLKMNTICSKYLPENEFSLFAFIHRKLVLKFFNILYVLESLNASYLCTETGISPQHVQTPSDTGKAIASDSMWML